MTTALPVPVRTAICELMFQEGLEWCQKEPKIVPALNTCDKNEGVGDRNGCKLGTRGGDRVSRLGKVRALTSCLAPRVPDPFCSCHYLWCTGSLWKLTG